MAPIVEQPTGLFGGVHIVLVPDYFVRAIAEDLMKEVDAGIEMGGFPQTLSVSEVLPEGLFGRALEMIEVELRNGRPEGGVEREVKKWKGPKCAGVRRSESNQKGHP